MGPNLVGRSGELTTLTDAARRLVGGYGGFVHLVGEAGAGKTSLLAATTTHLEHEGIAVRTAIAEETSRYRPLAVARGLFPELPADPGPDPIGTALAVLERAAAINPVALLADDAHWADDASLDVLGAVARRARTLGVLLVTSHRPHPVPQRLRRIEETTAADGTRIDLAPLSSEAVAALVGERCGVPPGPDLSAWLAQAAGNPFLVVELLAGLAAERRLVVKGGLVDVEQPGALPGNLVERLARRVFLAVPGREVALRAAAVIPEGFTVEELVAVLGRPLTDVLAVALAAVDAGVLVDTTPILAFSHDLMRQAVLESTPSSILRTLNRRVAAVLTERRADPERVATCLLAGCDPADPSDVERLLAAGRSMRETHPVAAAALLRRGLDGICLGDQESTSATIEVGWALLAAGRGREVGALVHERLGHLAGPRPLELLRLEGVALSLTGRLGDAAAQYQELDTGGLPGELDADDGDVVDAAAELALLRVTSGRLREARRLIEWVEASPTSDSAFRQASVSTARAWLAATRGAFETAAQHARTALVAVVHDDTFGATAGSPNLALGLALDALGDSEGALAVFRRGSTTGGSPRWAPPLLQFGAAVTLFRRGDWDDALAEAEAGLLSAEESGLGLGIFWPFAIGTLVSSARGQLARAQDWLDRGEVITAPGALGTEWLAYASAVRLEADGDLEGAAAVLERLTLTVIDAGASALLLNGGTDMVRLALATRRRPAATKVAAALHGMTRETASPVVAAIATWARGLLEGDAAQIEAAADRLATHRRVPEAARACHDAAVVAAARGSDPPESRRLATRAFAAYEELGAQQLHLRLRSDLRACGLAMRPRRSPPRPRWGWDSLTASEDAVVELAGEGLTNSEMAERLYVSRRTVESHLGRVYTKLDLSTRTQLVAAAARRGKHRGR